MKLRLILLSTLVVIASLVLAFMINEQNNQERIKLNSKLQEEKLLSNIKKSYARNVVTSSKSNLYIKKGKKFIYKGFISKNIDLVLDNVDNITIKNKYFKISNMPYYIYYGNVSTGNKLDKTRADYENYIVFNENIVTKTPFALYDENDNLVFKLFEEVSFPIIIKDDNKYFVKYNDTLLYVLKTDVKEIKPSLNTNERYTDGIAVLNYHFFYNPLIGEKCDEVICLTTTKFEEQLKYLSDNGFYATKMKDLELFIDGKIRLPEKSVSITIDDGGVGVADKAVPLLKKYKKNATLFLVTAWWDKGIYSSPYLEIHSHGHNLHNQGVCSGGQGGAIKCLDKELLLNDLATSRQKLNGSTVFCYPFYEYNDYAINILKEAGFNMAFAYGRYKIKSGANKLVLPRYIIYSSITLNGFAKMIR